MGTEIVFQLTKRELDLLLALEAGPAVAPLCHERTMRALVNKRLVNAGDLPTLTPAGHALLSFTRACRLFTSNAGAEEGT